MVYFYYDLKKMSPAEARTRLIEDTKTVVATPQRPLFILLEQVNLFDEARTSKLSSIEYSYANIEQLFDMLEHPERAWDIYYSKASFIGSDPVARIASKAKKPSEREEYPDVWETLSIAVYNANEDMNSKLLLKGTVFEDFVNHIPPFTEFQKHNNGCFNAKFNNKYEKTRQLVSKTDFYDYWMNIINNMEERRNFCYKKQFLDPILRSEEKAKIGDVPCAIYAMNQGGVPIKIIDDLYRYHVCYGNTIKTKDLHMVLSMNNYRLRVSKISIPNGKKFKVTSNEYPKRNKDNENWPVIWLDFYNGHLMFHEDIFLGENKRKVPFLRLLHWAFREGILVLMNSYEFAQLSHSGGFALNYKISATELIENLDDGAIFDSDCIPVKGKKLKSYSIKIFADFECTTDEQYHRPFCISYKVAKGDFKLKHGHIWGEDCGKKFLELIRDKVDNFTKCDERYKLRYKRPCCCIYFHNLKYDFTFLLRYLRNIKVVKKGNHLYSATGVFGRGLGKICMEFRDTVGLLQSTLKKAGESYLDEKTKKTIKKEAFPYELYTYSFFEQYPDFWCPLEVFKEGFKGSPLLSDFDNILGNLPSKIYDSENNKINYKKYAFFYCDQDVRVLYHVMKNFSKLLTASGNIEGVEGNPPFSADQDPYCHLTISSLSYDYFLKKTALEWRQIGVNQRGDPVCDWAPKYNYMFTRGLLRYIGHQTIRGGRVMTRDNEKWHYIADEVNKDSILVDYDGVSLYPSAISKLWMTEGEPKFIKGHYSEKEFLEWFTHPDAPEGEFKKYNDGWIHVYSLMCWKNRHFPLLCIKDEKTKLNEYQNFHGAVDTWVNAIDLFNLIEFQQATFYWNGAVVWEGERHYECRSVINELFQFRLPNKNHPIGNVTKLMMNSVYGKSALKPTNYEELVIDSTNWRKLGEDENIQWEKVDNWREFFNANAYRIKEFTYLDKDHIELKLHQLDLSSNFVPFGSNVLAMARRIIGRVMALAEDMEELHPECAPGLFYTDTDSMHIRKDLLKYTEDAYMEKYGQPICGKNLCQFHIDFDPCKNFKEDEEVIGAIESWFIMKKMYADKLLGSQGSIGYHQRMKGVPSDLVHWEHYTRIYNDEFVEFDLLENGHVSFFYEDGMVGSRRKMTRQIATKVAREELQEDLNTVNNFVKALEQLEKEENPAKKRKIDEDEDDNTVELLPSEQEWETFDEDVIVDIE